MIIPVAEFAQAHGWQPNQVRQLCQDLDIPSKASQRTPEHWQRLEMALKQGPSCVSHGIAQAPTDEPDPYPVGSRVHLKSAFEEWYPGWYKPEWWTVVEPANQFGIYGLQSDSGLSGGMTAWQIARDMVTP